MSQGNFPFNYLWPLLCDSLHTRPFYISSTQAWPLSWACWSVGGPAQGLADRSFLRQMCRDVPFLGKSWNRYDKNSWHEITTYALTNISDGYPSNHLTKASVTVGGGGVVERRLLVPSPLPVYLLFVCFFFLFCCCLSAKSQHYMYVTERHYSDACFLVSH